MNNLSNLLLSTGLAALSVYASKSAKMAKYIDGEDLAIGAMIGATTFFELAPESKKRRIRSSVKEIGTALDKHHEEQRFENAKRVN